MTPEQEEDLSRAVKLLENPSLGARIADVIGTPIEKAIALLPAKANEMIATAAHKAILGSVLLATKTMRDHTPGGVPLVPESSDWWHIGAIALSGMVCKVGKATTRNMQGTSALTFKDQPMGWMEVTRAANAGMVSAITTYEKSVKTRFGTLAIGADNVSLQMNGKPVLPGVAGNNSLSIAASYELGSTDVVLVQNTGGSGCPAMYSFITLTKTNLRATPEFGTCSDIIRVTSDLKSSVTVVMVGFSGPFESAAERGKAGMTKTVFRYANGRSDRISV